MKIGVFDSGIGGDAIAAAIATALPDATVERRDDRANLPYGSKTAAELHAVVTPKLRELESVGCEAIVIACNTVTTQLIDRLRAEFTVPLVGIEPMVKPAVAQTKTGIIAVCATPGTLTSERYAWLKATYAADVRVLEPDCSSWAAMIEASTIRRHHIEKQIEDVCAAGADVIVLGCTHYHWIDEMVAQAANGRAVVLEPTAAVIAQLQRVLAAPQG